jgi:hypothetical protein
MMTDPTLRAYFLGRLPEEEAQRIEEQVLEDDELFTTMRSAENDLFDDYAHHRLSGDEENAFLLRYGDRKDRIRFAKTLAVRKGNVATFRRRMTLAAAAVIGAIVISALFIMQPAPRVSDELPRPPVSVSAVETLELTLGTSRSAETPPSITLRNNVSTLHLRVHLDPGDRFEDYSMELRSAAGVSAWSAEGLAPIEREGDLSLSASVPAGSLSGGAYELSVRGGEEFLGFATLEIRRTD